MTAETPSPQSHGVRGASLGWPLSRQRVPRAGDRGSGSRAQPRGVGNLRATGGVSGTGPSAASPSGCQAGPGPQAWALVPVPPLTASVWSAFQLTKHVSMSSLRRSTRQPCGGGLSPPCSAAQRGHAPRLRPAARGLRGPGPPAPPLLSGAAGSGRCPFRICFLVGKMRGLEPEPDRCLDLAAAETLFLSADFPRCSFPRPGEGPCTAEAPARRVPVGVQGQRGRGRGEAAPGDGRPVLAPPVLVSARGQVIDPCCQRTASVPRAHRPATPASSGAHRRQ